MPNYFGQWLNSDVYVLALFALSYGCMSRKPCDLLLRHILPESTRRPEKTERGKRPAQRRDEINQRRRNCIGHRVVRCGSCVASRNNVSPYLAAEVPVKVSLSFVTVPVLDRSVKRGVQTKRRGKRTAALKKKRKDRIDAVKYARWPVRRT